MGPPAAPSMYNDPYITDPYCMPPPGHPHGLRMPSHVSKPEPHTTLLCQSTQFQSCIMHRPSSLIHQILFSHLRFAALLVSQPSPSLTLSFSTVNRHLDLRTTSGSLCQSYRCQNHRYLLLSIIVVSESKLALVFPYYQPLHLMIRCCPQC